jgi:hypothetical protein
MTQPELKLTTTDAVRTEHLVTPCHWFVSGKNGADGAWATDERGEKFSFFINRQDTWARPLIGREDLEVLVRTWSRSHDGYIKSDLMPLHLQPEEVQHAVGLVEAPTTTVAESATSTAKKAVKPARQRLGRNVQSGSCKPPAERSDPLKWSALVNNLGESNRVWRQWEAFQEATGNEIGLSTFAGMCLLEGLDSVVSKYRAR